MTLDDKTREPCGECGRAVRRWRACGRSCSIARAYCPEHGGEARAEQEIVAHHASHDRGEELRVPHPTVRGYWVLDDGTTLREESDAELRKRIKEALGIA